MPKTHDRTSAKSLDRTTEKISDQKNDKQTDHASKIESDQKNKEQPDRTSLTILKKTAEQLAVIGSLTHRTSTAQIAWMVEDWMIKNPLDERTIDVKEISDNKKIVMCYNGDENKKPGEKKDVGQNKKKVQGTKEGEKI